MLVSPQIYIYPKLAADKVKLRESLWASNQPVKVNLKKNGIVPSCKE